MPAYVVPTTFTAYDRYTPTLMLMSGATERFAHKANRVGVDIGKLFTRPKNVVDGMLNSLTGGSFNARMLGVFGAGGLIATGLKYIIDAAGEAEAATYSFVPSTGSLENAKSLTQDLYKEAERTSFSFMGLAQPTKMLLSMGAATRSTVLPTLRMLGDLAMGDADKLGLITLAYSQIKSMGKLTGQDANQLSQHIPILPELSKMWGVSIAKVRDLMKEGKITFSDVNKAMMSMTSSKGAFGGAAATRMLSLSGQAERLTEYLQGAARELGDAMLPAVKQLVGRFGEVVIRTKEWAMANKDLVAQQADKWFTRIGDKAIWVYNNFGLVTTAVEWYVGALVSLKAISMVVATYQYGMAIATAAYNVYIGIAGVLTGVASVKIGQSAIAMGAYQSATWMANTATNVFSASLRTVLLTFEAITAAIGLATAAYMYHKSQTEDQKRTWVDKTILKRTQDDLWKNYESQPKEMDRELAMRKAMESTAGKLRREQDSLKQVGYNLLTKGDDKGVAFNDMKINAINKALEQAFAGRNYIQGRENDSTSLKEAQRISVEQLKVNATQNDNSANGTHKFVFENNTPFAMKQKGQSKGLYVRIDSTKGQRLDR